MKVLKENKWVKKVKCAVKCGSKLEIEANDLYLVRTCYMDEDFESHVYFTCPVCGISNEVKFKINFPVLNKSEYLKNKEV